MLGVVSICVFVCVCGVPCCDAGSLHGLVEGFIVSLYDTHEAESNDTLS